MKGIKIVNRKKETCSTFKLKLEPGTYSITELGKIINFNGKQAIDRKLRSWEVSYSSKSVFFIVITLPKHFF